MNRLCIFLLCFAFGMLTQVHTSYDGGSTYGPLQTYYAGVGILSAVFIPSLARRLMLDLNGQSGVQPTIPSVRRRFWGV
jgi:hypothetical protein